MYAHVFVCVAAMACLIYQTKRKIQNRLCVLVTPCVRAATGLRCGLHRLHAVHTPIYTDFSDQGYMLLVYFKGSRYGVVAGSGKEASG